MPDPEKMRDTIEDAVSAVLNERMPSICDEVSKRILLGIQSLLSEAPDASPSQTLNAAIVRIQQSTAQTDILNAMLDGMAEFAGRTALFILRGSAAIGWQARGFRDNDAIRILSVDPNLGLISRAMQQRDSVFGPTLDFDQRFVAGFGAPASGNCAVLPLVIRDKVAAFVYADSGTSPDGILDLSALQLLIRAAANWVELLGFKKAGPAPAVTQSATAMSPSPQIGATAGVSAAAPEQLPEQNVSPEHGEIHKKARRFAKLLVDEIKLYNNEKVELGRRGRDLYDRLKDDIEKSRATYDKRYAQTPASSEEYFDQELIRNLAENDVSLMGSNFPRQTVNPRGYSMSQN